MRIVLDIMGLILFGIGLAGLFFARGAIAEATSAILLCAGAIFLVGGCLMHALNDIKDRLK